MMRSIIRSWTPTKMIAVGYLVIILTGALLLTLPVASKGEGGMPFIDALFAATTSTCVTGLVLQDLYTTWTLFGQIVILLLIQIGGIGFMTIAVTALMIAGRKIGLSSRLTMQEAVGAPQVGGIVKFTKFLLLGTLTVEGIGAVLLSFVYCPRLGFFKGVYFGIFHSVSAFCNAGLDLNGAFAPGSSLMEFKADPIINITIMALIVIGGLGFFVWRDVVQNKWHFKKYRLHTKIVLVTTAFLILSGAGLILLFEYNGKAMAGLTGPEKVMAAFFQSITPRTAGFDTLGMANLTQASQLLIMGLMLIGGSPGSTAGGIKTTSFAVLVLTIVSEIKKRKYIEVFKHRAEDDVLKQVCTLLVAFLLLIFSATLAICAIDGLPVKDVMFEVFSAIGTVGLTLGITPHLTTIPRLIIIMLMFIGRVGCITLLLAFGGRRASKPSQWPVEKITIG